MLTVTEGKIIDGLITVKIAPKIEHGALKTVNALIMHQTGGSDAAGTLASYKTSPYGAHFLIDTDGTIYQTARVTRQTFHIGKIKARCYELHSCSAKESAAIKTILKSKVGYREKVKRLSEHEADKDYPSRYPTNADSIGIEVVGTAVSGEYDEPTPKQDASVKWLATELLALFHLTATDVYRHPQVSYKEPSEARHVKW